MSISTPQLETLRAYLALAALRPTWPGALILALGLESQAIPFAANIAGAACLAIDPSPALCRAAMRSGACDFLVNTVDEALRILKNEIRQKKPISIALESDLKASDSELSNRGVLPQLFLDTTESGAAEAFPAAAKIQSILEAHSWTAQAFPFETSAALRDFDLRLQSLIHADDLRHRWILAVPRLFPRDRTRHVCLTPAESQHLKTLPTTN